jgi:hypothetical protein
MIVRPLKTLAWRIRKGEPQTYGDARTLVRDLRRKRRITA